MNVYNANYKLNTKHNMAAVSLPKTWVINP